MTALTRKRPAAIRTVIPFVFRHWLDQPVLALATAGCLLAATVADLFMPVFSGYLVDALTGAPIAGPDGQPIYLARPDLSVAIKAPPRLEKSAVNDLIESLSLLDPDPVVRIASIRGAGARAGRVIPDPADEDRYVAAEGACGARCEGAGIETRSPG